MYFSFSSLSSLTLTLSFALEFEEEIEDVLAFLEGCFPVLLPLPFFSPVSPFVYAF